LLLVINFLLAFAAGVSLAVVRSLQSRKPLGLTNLLSVSVEFEVKHSHLVTLALKYRKERILEIYPMRSLRDKILSETENLKLKLVLVILDSSQLHRCKTHSSKTHKSMSILNKLDTLNLLSLLSDKRPSLARIKITISSHFKVSFLLVRV